MACRKIGHVKYDQMVAKILESYPISAGKKDINGDLPLHMALRSSEHSTYVVNLLLAAYPLAVQCKTRKDFYPLHIACDRMVSETIILTLIDMYPKAAEHIDCQLGSPLHATCGRIDFSIDVAMHLLDVYPDAAKVSTYYGETVHLLACQNSNKQSENLARRIINTTALHLACSNCNKHSEKLLFRLINIFPEAIEKHNNDEEYPLHCVCGNSHNLSMKLLLTVFPFDGLPSDSSLNDDYGFTPLTYLFCSLRIVRQLPRCQFHMEHEREKISSIALYLLDAYPNQALCKCHADCYPLHYACHQGVDDKIILCVLNINLEAVKQKCKHGKYPLDYAKESNLTKISYVLEEIMKKDNDALKNRVGIPSIVTSHDITNVFRCSIMDWVQCNTPTYIEGKYTQTVPETKQIPSCPTFDNANCGTWKRERGNDGNLECTDCKALEK